MDEFIALALRVTVSLTVVLAALWLLQRRLARGRRVRSESRIRVLGRHALSRRASIVVVEADGKRLLLGVTEQQISVLQDATVAPAASEPVPSVSGPVPEPIRARQASSHTSLAESDEIPERRSRRRAGAAPRLDGSILSRGTWRQAAAALRQGK